MSKVDDVINAEAETLERAKVPDTVRATRRRDARSRMFSVRLSDDELAELVDAAEQRGLPARTLARAWLLDRLHAEQGAGAADLATRVDRLEHAVFPG